MHLQFIWIEKKRIRQFSIYWILLDIKEINLKKKRKDYLGKKKKQR